jgi:hypothetical protein
MREVLGTKEREVEVSGLEEVGTFSIAANAKAFKTLIDSLYTAGPCEHARFAPLHGPWECPKSTLQGWLALIR